MIELWESVTWVMENKSYCYVDEATGRRVDQKTKKFIDWAKEFEGEILTDELEKIFDGKSSSAFDIKVLEMAKNAVLLDLYTASMLQQIWAVLSEKNKAGLYSQDFTRAIEICWKLAAPYF